MIHRTTAVSSDVGDPLELISANPPPITSAAKASTQKNSDALRAPLQRKRDCEWSGGPDPFLVGSRSADTPRHPNPPRPFHRLHRLHRLLRPRRPHRREVYFMCP